MLSIKSSKSKEKKHKFFWNKIICKTEFKAQAYNSCFVWVELDNDIFGLSLKGIVLGLLCSLRTIIK